jgi:hypothetical protein
VKQETRMVYWHRELPPFNAEPLGSRPGNHCKDELMLHANQRLVDEIVRLGGRYAHVLNESIDTKHGDRQRGMRLRRSASLFNGPSDSQRIKVMPADALTQYGRNLARAAGSVVTTRVSVRKIDSAAVSGSARKALTAGMFA